LSAVDGKWYDLSKWAPLHPGGEFILTMFNNKDATDAFHSLHSTDAHNRLKHMHATPVLSTDPVAAQRPSKVALAFRDFRAKLIEEGWFSR
jgi:cytochrome b involved in lipid metabolism